MNRSNYQTIGGCVLALSVGAIAGLWQRQPPEIPNATVEAVAVADPAANSGRPLDPTLANEVREDKGARRWMVLLAASEQASAAEMPALIRAAGKDATVARMLAARWAELDPMHMFRALHAEYLIDESAPGALPSRWALTEALYEHWTKVDAPAVIKALNEIPNFSRRDSLRMTVVNHLMKNDVEQGLIAMTEWKVRNYLPDLKKVAEWADKDPRHAAEVAVNMGDGYANQEILKHIGKSWAKRDPQGGIDFAQSLSRKAGASLARELASEWAQRDLSAAADFVAAHPDPSFRSALASGVVAAWAKTDPVGALGWSNEHLRGLGHTEAIGNLVKAAAEKDLTAAADLVAGMEPGAAQNRACASIFETWWNKGKSEQSAALDWLATIPDPTAREQAFERVQWTWMWNDPTGAKDFISGPHGKLASSQMVNQVARSQGQKNPEAALEWAKSLSGTRAKEAKGAVFEGWLNVRPDAAAEYTRKLPKGEDRDDAVRRITQTLVWQSPQQAANWYHSLPAADQKAVKEIYDQSQLAPPQRAELDKALAK